MVVEGLMLSWFHSYADGLRFCCATCRINATFCIDFSRPDFYLTQVAFCPGSPLFIYLLLQGVLWVNYPVELRRGGPLGSLLGTWLAPWLGDTGAVPS